MAKAKELPVDLHRDIIGRLSDPNSLYRFKSVSKLWLSLIAEIKRVELVIVSQPRVYSADLDLDLDLDSPSSSLRVKEHPLPPGIMDGATLSLRGSCNGFFVFQSFENIILWRKFIRDYQIITQKPKFRVPQSTLIADRFILYGFGYDSVTDDYKLVNIMCVYYEMDGPRHFEIKVYSLRNNTWTSPRTSPILFPRIYHSMHNTSQAVLVGSGLHWVAYRDYKCKTPPFVLTFDLIAEDFHVIGLPDKSEATVVGRLGGNLTVTHPKPKDQVVDIWVMKEYMVEESWSLLFRISIHNNGGRYPYAAMRPLAVSSRNGNKLLLESGSFLFWYDPESDKLDDVNFSPPQLRNINGTAIFLWPTT